MSLIKQIFSILILMMVLFKLNSYSQFIPSFNCATPDSNIVDPYNGGPKTGYINLVIVFFDFPNGRLPGNRVPVTNEQLDSVLAMPPKYDTNIEAVSRFGYVRVGGLLTEKCMKYTYQNAWDRQFSIGTYLGANHPDYYDYVGYVDSTWITGYGSMRDWFREVSYGNLDMLPGITHASRTGIYQIGIVNDTMVINGNVLIMPICLPKNRYDYPQEGVSFVDALIGDGKTVLERMHNNDSLEFDVDSYLQDSHNKIEFIYAGYGNNDINAGQILVVQEKIAPNIYSSISCLEGLAADAHELGHSIGWQHTNFGSYCIMTPSGKFGGYNCPQHPCIILKLLAGWIDSSYVRKINSETSIQNLPPSFSHGDCAAITIYGKAGYGNSWKHSEMIILENRRKLGFDKFITPSGQTYPYPPPSSFDGGCLIWKFSNYGSYPQDPCVFRDLYLNMKLITPTGFENFGCDSSNHSQSYGNSSHFWGVDVNNSYPRMRYTLFDSSKSYSAAGFPTGIQVSGINDPGNGNINFNNYYFFGPPPNYNIVLYGQQLTNPINLFGNVFIISNDIVHNNYFIIDTGTILDFANSELDINGGNIKAIGTDNNPITFRGCGYDNGSFHYRLNESGIAIGNRALNPLYNLDTTIISNCNFYNISNSGNYPFKTISIWDSTSNDVPIIIKNNQFMNSLGNCSILLQNLNGSFKISSIENNFNSNVLLNSTVNYPFKIIDGIQIPQSSTLTFISPRIGNSKYVFDNNATFLINGTINAIDSTLNHEIIFDDLNGSGWNGIQITNMSGSATFQNCHFYDALTGILFNSQNGLLSVKNSKFTKDLINDISIFCPDVAPGNIIQNNLFEGNENKLSDINLQNVAQTRVINNIFEDDYSTGLLIQYSAFPIIQSNIFQASLYPNVTPIAILSYSSQGIYCNNTITNYSNGILLNSSSPFLLSNIIYNNGRGLFLTNASNPNLIPSMDPNQTVFTGGFNQIINNSLDEIYYYDNNDGSFPLLDQGQNTILDTVYFSDTLISTYVWGPTLFAILNFWGGDPYGRFMPGNNIVYIPYLDTASSIQSCSPNQMIVNNNLSQEILLYGSANINFKNHQYTLAIQKYKQLLDIPHDTTKSGLYATKIYQTALFLNTNFYDHQKYFETLEQQAGNSKFRKILRNLAISCEVQRPCYLEAINKYQQIIDDVNSTELEKFYASLDQIHAINLYLDSISNSNNNHNNFNPMYKGPSNSKINKQTLNLKLFINNFNENLKKYIDNYINEIKTNRKNSNNNEINKILINNDYKKQNIINKKSKINNNEIKNTTSDIVNSKMIKQILSKYNKYLDKFKNGLVSEKMDYSNINSINNFIKKLNNFKLLEFSIKNFASSERPLNKLFLNKNKNIFEKTILLPKYYKLSQNYPNPFNPTTKIDYQLPNAAKVTIKVYDILGKLVRTLVNNEQKESGYYSITFDGTNFASGIYFYKIEARQVGSSTGNFIETKKMILLK